MISASPTTLSDWYAKRQQVTVEGGPTVWQRRALRMMFDGATLGDHVLPPDSNEHASEKLWEKDAAARTLVSGNLDGTIKYLTSIAVAPPMQTPDFVARLTDGRDVVVEQTRICGKDDKLIVKSLGLIQRWATQFTATTALPRGRVTFALPSAPILKFAKDTAAEMVRAMKDTVSFRSTERVPLDTQYPMLKELGVRWTVDDPTAPAEAIVRPWTIATDPQVVADEIFEIIRKKGDKHASYLAHGEAVWLTVFIDTTFCLPTTVLHRLERMDVQRGPFAKVIVGCSTRASVYDVKGVSQHHDF